MSGQALVKLFREDWRGLGDSGSGLGMIFDFQFRKYIHHFSGAKLHVFLAIVLHAGKDGVSYPGYALLEKETGYQQSTIARVLNELCEMEIEGHRVLYRFRERDSKGRFRGSNRYLIFPKDDEIAKDESPEEPKNVQSSILPNVDKSRFGEIEVEENPDSKENPDSEGNPQKKKGADAPSAAARSFSQVFEIPEISIYHKTSEVIPSSKDVTQIVEAVQFIQEREGFESAEQLISYLLPFWWEWSSRRTKAGRPHNKLSLTWLAEWAVNDEIPPGGDWNHPAVRAYEEITQIQLQEWDWELVQSVDNIPLWRASIVEYLKRGYDPKNNVDAILEFYHVAAKSATGP